MKSIEAQSYEPIETIFVDNGSADKTKELAKKYTKNVFDKGPERSAQRNFGMIDKTKGKYVMFIDCDMILSPHLIEKCVELMEKSDAVALHIPEIVLGRNYWSQVRRFERSFYNGTVIDGARFFRCDKFKEVGGFDETLAGPEDWDIDKKIKKIGRIGLLNSTDKTSDPTSQRLPSFAQGYGAARRGASWKLNKFILERGVNPAKFGSVVYHNESEFNLGKYLTKKGYYATSFDSYIQKWGKDDPDIKKQLGLKYRYVGVFIENGKWLKLLSRPDLTLGMAYLRFMVGIKYIFRKHLSQEEFII